MLNTSTQSKQSFRRRLLANTISTNSFQELDSALGRNRRKACENGPNKGTDDAALLYKQCLDAARAGNIDLALNLITRACSTGCVPAQYHRVKADLLRRCEKGDEAVRVLQGLVEQKPEDAPSWALLGDFLAERKEFSASKRCYETAIGLDPTQLGSIHNLATVLQLSRHVEEAEALYREVIRRAPLHLDANLNLAGMLNAAGRYREGLSIVEGILAHNPRIAKAYLIGSVIEFNMGRYAIALKWIEDAIALAPDQITLLTPRASILSKLGYDDLALADCNKVIEYFPNDFYAWRQKALVLRSLNRANESLDSLLVAESVSPDPASVAVDRAWFLAELGRKDQALQLVDKTLAAQPNLACALDCRSFLMPLKPDHPDLAAMEKIVDDPNSPMNDRVRLSLSIGRVYLNADDGEMAFRYLNLGNELKRKTLMYDRATEERWFADIMKLFSPESMADLADMSRQVAKPIFVFGMPRSGTTLVEQILASHRVIHGTGETPYLDTLARTSVLSGSPGLSADNLVSCGNRYLELINARRPADTRIVDKTNSNFLYAGLISLLFPGARMIHCRRNPIDTCLSCYSLLFAHGNEFSYDLGELGHYYGLHRRMMAHWRNLLGPKVLLEVDYELLVDDTEAQVRRILDFCELPWDDGCLRFYETKRLVTTSSFDQVRSPIYKSRVGRAERFRPWLGALEEALENVPKLESIPQNGLQ